MSVAPAVELESVTFAYRRGDTVLVDTSLRVEQGEFVAIAGPNGGGKTTLLRLVLGLESPSAGRVALFGEQADRFSRRARLGYLPQRSHLRLDVPVTVREVVAAGRLPASRLLGRPRSDDRRHVEGTIARVGLAEQADVELRRLSGGQQQRALIAKALASEPDLLALDEPTTGVDAESQGALAELLAHLNDELGVTILYVSHEFGAVERYVERIVLVHGGIVFDGSPRDLPGLWHDPSHVHV